MLQEFICTVFKNLIFWALFSISTIFLTERFVLQVYKFNNEILFGSAVIILGNLSIYCFTTSLYYWKSSKRKSLKHVRDYLEDKDISLRPLAGFIEINLYVFFFLVNPLIIAGYLIVKGTEGFRGEKPEGAKKGQKQDFNFAYNTGEFSSISHIGTVTALFVGIAAAIILSDSTVGEVLKGWKSSF